MEYSLKIVRKQVKHLRIKIVDEKTVFATAPLSMPKETILWFVEKKKNRIAKHLTALQESRKQFLLWPSQILLHGEPYTTIQRDWQGTQYTIDHKGKFIRWWFDLHQQKQQMHRYHTYAKKLLPQRLQQLWEQHSISYNKCFVRDQKSKRWSCSSLWHIGLNWRLVKAPMRIMDYVICHELAHRRHMNHSQDFWNHCTALFPKTQEARSWLKQYGSVLR